MTIIIFIEDKSRHDTVDFDREGTFLVSMLILLAYGLVTAG